jgi:hypothetical protein
MDALLNTCKGDEELAARNWRLGWDLAAGKRKNKTACELEKSPSFFWQINIKGPFSIANCDITRD